MVFGSARRCPATDAEIDTRPNPPFWSGRMLTACSGRVEGATPYSPSPRHPWGGVRLELDEMQLGGPVLSERLASLEVTSLDAAELSQLIADEALRLFGGERAVLWRYRPTLRRLFVEQRTHEIRSVDVDEAAAEDLFRAPPSLSVAREGIWYEIVEASFGVAPEERPGQVLALPLCAGGDPVALLLMESHPEGWDEELGGPGVDGGRERVLESFGAQVVALLANHEALVRSR